MKSPAIAMMSGRMSSLTHRKQSIRYCESTLGPTWMSEICASHIPSSSAGNAQIVIGTSSNLGQCGSTRYAYNPTPAAAAAADPVAIKNFRRDKFRYLSL